MYPIASEHPGNLGSGPPDFTMTLNIAQPNAPFFDIPYSGTEKGSVGLKG
ncbi:hypothetical protein B0H14DRAFT_3596086 [Mycena olivaceomarginata]|nr:hypothetical protein B0H14DRAFT_3596086 [Mycena olivaceomarginata]